MSEVLKPKPAGLVQPVQSQERIMQKFKEIMSDPECAKALCDQVIPMMQPKAPQNSTESGSRTTLFLESKVSEDKRTIAALSAKAALSVQAYQTWLQTGQCHNTAVPSAEISEPRGPTIERLQQFEPRRAQERFEEIVAAREWRNWWNYLGEPLDPWWYMTMRPIEKKTLQYFTSLLREWEDIKMVWVFPEEKEVHMLVGSRAEALLLYGSAQICELQVTSCPCPPQDAPKATTTNAEPLEATATNSEPLEATATNSEPLEVTPCPCPPQDAPKATTTNAEPLEVTSCPCPPQDAPKATATNSEPLEADPHVVLDKLLNKDPLVVLDKLLNEGRNSDTAPPAPAKPPYQGKNYAGGIFVTVGT